MGGEETMNIQTSGSAGTSKSGASRFGIRKLAIPIVAGLLPFGISSAQAAAINLFQQTGAPLDPNVSIAINNPQNMSGGQWAGGAASPYPVYGPSPVLDGDTGTWWNAGTESDGKMLNVAMTKGYYSLDHNSFTNIAFDQIGRIRIYATEQPTGSGVWNNFAKQIKVAYTTAALNPGNGFKYNSSTLGDVPGDWNMTAAITGVNGVAPSAAADSVNYSTAKGWVATDFSQGVTTVGNGLTEAYMDLTLAIPAGATSVMISFGEDNINTGNQGGMMINEIQAFVPEPASLGLLGLVCVGMLGRRHKRASV